MIARMNVGGPAAIIETLAAHASPDVRHVVVTGPVTGEEAEWAAHRGAGMRRVVVGSLTSAIAPRQDLLALRDLCRTLRRLAPDVVHTHTAKAGILGRPAARLAGVPGVVHTYHGHVLTGYFGPRTTAAYTQLERALAPLADRLLTVGDAVGEDLLRAGIGRATQYRTLVPGVMPLVLPPRQAARETLGILPDTPVVAGIGRLTKIKRPDRLAPILRHLEGLGLRPTLVVAGDGEERSALAAAVAPFGDRVRLLGWTGEVGAILAAADVLLLTSDNEGMPITLIEGALAGVPAVATAVGSVGEVVLDGVTGRVVPPDVPALARAVAALLADPGMRSRMGRAAATRAAQVFCPEVMVTGHEAVYRDVLNWAPPAGMPGERPPPRRE